MTRTEALKTARSLISVHYSRYLSMWIIEDRTSGNAVQIECRGRDQDWARQYRRELIAEAAFDLMFPEGFNASIDGAEGLTDAAMLDHMIATKKELAA